jgi:hypothetical protein
MVTATGVGFLLTGFVLRGLFADDAALQRLANQSQVVGVLLAALGAIAGTAQWITGRLGNDHDLEAWKIRLTAKVRQAEDRNRLALIGGVHAADLRLGASDPEHEIPELEGRFVDDTSSEPLSLNGLGKFYRGLGVNGRLVIVGEPGAGKTLSIIDLILQLIAADDQARPIPVRFNLASWTPGITGEAWLARQLVLDYDVPPRVADELVASAGIMPIFDGLDEMDNARGEGDPPVRAVEALDWLNDGYIRDRALAPLVLTCRARQYAELRNTGKFVHGASEIRLLELEPEQIRTHVRNVFAHDAHTRATWEPVLDKLDDPHFAPIWATLSTPWRLTLAVTLVKDGRDPVDLLTPRPGESPSSASSRIERELLAGYIPAATRLAAKLTPEHQRQDRQYNNPTQVQRWLADLAERLTRDTGDSSEYSVVDISPATIFAGRGPQRLVHAATAAALVGVAACVVALDGIGSPAVWLFYLEQFMSDDQLVFEKVVQYVLPVVVLPAVPLIAWRRAAVAQPTLSVKTSDEHQYGRRIAECMRYCLLGAAAAGTINSFFVIVDFFDVWNSWTVKGPFLALFILGAVYGALFWMRVKCGAWTSIAVFLVSLLVLMTLPAQVVVRGSLSLPLVGEMFVWSMPAAFMFALFLELSRRAATGLSSAISPGPRERYPVFGTLIFIGAGVPFVIVTNFLYTGPTASVIFVENSAERFVALGVAAGLFSGIAATAYRRSIADGLAVGVATLFCVGLLTGTKITLDDLIVQSVDVGLLLLGGLVASAIAALFLRAPTSGEVDVRSARLALRDDLYASLGVTIAVAAPVFVFLGLGIAAVFGVPDVSIAGSFVAATLFGLGFGLIGRRTWYRYRVGHALAVAKGDLPPRLLSFMDWAVDAGLLRASGSSYQFRHLQLQNWVLHHAESAPDTIPQ